MRLHIELDDELVAQVDRLAGPRGRSTFVREVLTEAIEQQVRWEHLERALGSIADTGHEWDPDPAAWVRAQRHGDPKRGG